MRLLLLAALLSALLIGGCVNSSPPPPEYRPTADKNLTPPVYVPPKTTGNGTPANPVVPVDPPRNNSNGTAPKTNTSVKNNTTLPNSSMPAVNTTVTVPGALPCLGIRTTDALDCLAQLSIAQKDVLVCTQLSDKTDRLKCFNRWCSSGARDYHQCDKLTNTDDRLGCLVKCNPNFNT